MQHVFIDAPKGRVAFGPSLPLAFILGPCVIESRDHALKTASFLAWIAGRAAGHPARLQILFRQGQPHQRSSYRGLGIEEALRILEAVKQETGLPVTTDVHEREQCAPVAEVADLQILGVSSESPRPTSFNCSRRRDRPDRQREEEVSSSPPCGYEKNVAKKLDTAGASGVLLTERGTSFGYNTLVVDMRACRSWPASASR